MLADLDCQSYPQQCYYFIAYDHACMYYFQSIHAALNDKAEVVEYIHGLSRHTLIQLGGVLGLHYHSQGKTTSSGIFL